MNYFVLIPVSISLGLIGLAAFFWALLQTQYDDLDGAAARILNAPDTPASPIPSKENLQIQITAKANQNHAS